MTELDNLDLVKKECQAKLEEEMKGLWDILADIREMNDQLEEEIRTLTKELGDDVLEETKLQAVSVNSFYEQK